jgi:beta-alanine degradation protein BauB
MNELSNPSARCGQFVEPHAGDGGVTRRDVLALLAGFGVSAAALAQDPPVIAPKNYRVVFENDRVRVLEYSNRPGLGPCGVGRHYHPAHLDIFLTAFSGRMTHQDGTVSQGSVKPGDVHWYEAEFHEVENIDKSASQLIMVELKDAKWKPSTG